MRQAPSRRGDEFIFRGRELSQIIHMISTPVRRGEGFEKYLIDAVDVIYRKLFPNDNGMKAFGKSRWQAHFELRCRSVVEPVFGQIHDLPHLAGRIDKIFRKRFRIGKYSRSHEGNYINVLRRKSTYP